MGDFTAFASAQTPRTLQTQECATARTEDDEESTSSTAPLCSSVLSPSFDFSIRNLVVQTGHSMQNELKHIPQFSGPSLAR